MFVSCEVSMPITSVLLRNLQRWPRSWASAHKWRPKLIPRCIVKGQSYPYPCRCISHDTTAYVRNVNSTSQFLILHLHLLPLSPKFIPFSVSVLLSAFEQYESIVGIKVPGKWYYRETEVIRNRSVILLSHQKGLTIFIFFIFYILLLFFSSAVNAHLNKFPKRVMMNFHDQ